jgi:flavine halogenase
MSESIDTVDVAIIGGGPGGSTTATLLAREGLNVAVFERETFPRYHIGESLLTSIIPVLKFTGLYDRVDQHGFVRKYRAYFRIVQGTRAAHLEFSRVHRESEDNAYTYQVVRSEFDKLLLDYAAECGARVHEGTTVVDIQFDGERPVSIEVVDAAGRRRQVRCRHLVDASGLSGLLSSRYLKNRRYQEAFANIAMGSYWRDFNHYVDDDGVEQVGAFTMEAIPDGSGWIWAIPLHDDTLSVGAVVHRDTFKRLKGLHHSVEAVYMDILKRCPDVQRLLDGATASTAPRVWKDYSYAADSFAGTGYRLVGDAAAFIDPFFSSGVHLAMYGALSAAATISASVRGEIDESQAATYHTRCVRDSYIRFAVIVAGVYGQIRNQEEVVLSGMTDSDIQPAFEAISPVVTGRFDFQGGGLEHVLAYVDELVADMKDPEGDHPIGKLLGRTMLGDKDALVMQGLAPVEGLRIRMERGRLGLEPVP